MYTYSFTHAHKCDTHSHVYAHTLINTHRHTRTYSIYSVYTNTEFLKTISCEKILHEFFLSFLFLVIITKYISESVCHLYILLISKSI